MDPYFIINKCPTSSNLLINARKINDFMPQYLLSKIEKFITKVNRPKIGVWGVAYKKNTSDIRNSPSMEIVNL